MTTNQIPAPFGPKYQQRTESGSTGDECVLCGRQTGGKSNTRFFRVVEGGSRFAHPDEQVHPAGDMGYFPVGSECAKALPADWGTTG